MSTSFSIIIVTWNGLHHLKTYLPSVLKSVRIEDEIIIADNHSTDGTKEWLKEHAPECKHLLLDENYGYCGGNNRAAEVANNEVLLFLNNDVRVSPDWLFDLDRAFQDNLLSAAQPAIYSDQQPDEFEYAGASGGFLDRNAYPFCRGRIFDITEVDHGQYNESIPILWASGAALAIRKEIFNSLGGFDEDFMFHMEEIDLCWRVWNHGGLIKVIPTSKVYHLGGGSLSRENPRKTYYNFRNNLLMIIKNTPKGSLAIRLWIRLVLDGVSALHFLIKGEFRSILAILKAHRDFYSLFRLFLKKREKELSSRTVSEDPSVFWNGNILTSFFLAGRLRYSDLKI